MIVTKRESTASLIHDTSPTLRHSLHNKGLYYGFRDAVLSRGEVARSGVLSGASSLLHLAPGRAGTSEGKHRNRC